MGLELTLLRILARADWLAGLFSHLRPDKVAPELN
jgi:hypothetical protein